MSGYIVRNPLMTDNPLKIQPPPEARPNVLAGPPQANWAGAMDENARLYSDALARDRAEQVRLGYVDPATGKLTPEGWKAQAQIVGGGFGPADIGGGFLAGVRGYHGSPVEGIKTLHPSESGALGPGVYASPFTPTAQRYAGPEGHVYHAELPDDLFYGAGGRWDEAGYGTEVNPYDVWRDQTSRVAAAAPEHLREAVANIGNWRGTKMGPGDGYPYWMELRRLTGSAEAAQEIMRRAGFKGLTGFADGPEIVHFDPLPVEPYKP